MKPVAVQTLRSRWFAGCVHAGLWLLLYLAVIHLGGQSPAFRENDTFTSPPESPAPVAKLEALFSPGIWPKPLAGASIANPFVTSHFVPAPVPPPPPPATTTKIELTYLGFYQTTNGPKQAVCKFFNTFVVSPIGARVASNLFVAQATMQMLTLTNPAAQSNLLTMNKKQEIEVPLR
jgi:hypothetical protein